jgi:hypothetical protein
MADIIDLNRLRRFMAEIDRDDRRVQMQHILIEAISKMKALGATGAEVTSLLRRVVDVLEGRGK